MSLRETILNASDITEELVKVPEWGGVEVMVRGLSVLERAMFIKQAANGEGGIDPEKGYPVLVIMSAREPVDDGKGNKSGGAHVFKPADRDALSAKNGKAVERITEVALRISGLMPDSVESAKGN